MLNTARFMDRRIIELAKTGNKFNGIILRRVINILKEVKRRGLMLELMKMRGDVRGVLREIRKNHVDSNPKKKADPIP